MTKKIKAAVIGCGEIAFSKHLPGLAKLKDVQLRCLSRKLSHLVKNFFEYHSCKSLFKNFAG